MARYTKTIRENVGQSVLLTHLHIESSATPSAEAYQKYHKYVARGDITDAEAERVVAEVLQVLK